MKELFSKSVLPNLREGSVQYEMAKEDPERFIAYSKAMGIPLDQAGMAEQLSKDVYSLSGIIEKGDAQGALQFAESLAAQREAQGLNSDRERQWLAGATEEFNSTGSLGKHGNAIKMMNEHMNGDLIAQAKDAQRKAALEEAKFGLEVEKLDLEKKKLAAGGGAGELSPKDVVMTPQGAYVFDKRTGGFKKGVDESGNAIIGASYDPELQRTIAGAKSGGAEQAKGNATRSQEFIKSRCGVCASTSYH